MRIPFGRAILAATYLLSLSSIASLVHAQGNARGTIGPSPYEVIPYWAEPFQENGYAFGGNSGIWAETPERIIIAQRGETVLPFPVPDDFPGFAGALGINVLTDTNRRTWQNCLYVVNGDGEVTEIWDHLDYLCADSAGPGPHRIRINPYDPEEKIWLVNETFHQIYVIANDGSEVLATYGEKGVPGDDADHYGRPQDVAFLPDGRILVADGLDNHRIIIYDADMNYLGEFGGFGDGPGQFNTIHSLGIGPEGRVLVTDRSGGEVNLFRTTDDPAVIEFERSIGSPLTLPLDIIVNDDGFWITDLGPLRFVKFDFEGNIQYTWLVPPDLPNGYLEVHTFSVDPEGNLYGGDNQYGRTQKFVPREGVDPALLIDPPWVAP